MLAKRDVFAVEVYKQHGKHQHNQKGDAEADHDHTEFRLIRIGLFNSHVLENAEQNPSVSMPSFV